MTEYNMSMIITVLSQVTALFIVFFITNHNNEGQSINHKKN